MHYNKLYLTLKETFLYSIHSHKIYPTIDVYGSYRHYIDILIEKCNVFTDLSKSKTTLAYSLIFLMVRTGYLTEYH